MMQSAALGILDFRGRISRMTFLTWYFIPLALGLVASMLGLAHTVGVQLLLNAAISFVFFSGGIKRLHDRDYSGWALALIFVPVVGVVLLCYECCFMQGTPGENRFGPDPLAGAGGARPAGLDDRQRFDPFGLMVELYSPEGRISRSTFWLYYLLPAFPVFVLLHLFHLDKEPSGNINGWNMLGISLFCLCWAGQTKRCHDLDAPFIRTRSALRRFGGALSWGSRSPEAAAHAFTPLFFGAVLHVLKYMVLGMFQPGTPGPNHFGPPPGGHIQARTKSFGGGAIPVASPSSRQAEAGLAKSPDAILTESLSRAIEDADFSRVVLISDSLAASDERRRWAYMEVATRLIIKGEAAKAFEVRQKALEIRFDLADAFRTAMEKIDTDKGRIAPETETLLETIQSLAPPDFEYLPLIVDYLDMENQSKVIQS